MKVFVFFICFYFTNLLGFAQSFENGKPEIESLKYLTIRNIVITGNTRTKDKTIFRELTFNESDTITLKQLQKHIAQSRTNLLNLPLFNFVEFDTIMANPTTVDITIELVERWYVWPYLLLYNADRNFSSWLRDKDFSKLYYGGGLAWYNFRGRNEKLKFNILVGYSNEFSIEYRNLYIDNAKRHALNASVSYLTQKQLYYTTINHERLTVKTEEILFRLISTELYYSFRKAYNVEHRFTISYENIEIGDTVALLNENYLGNRNTKRQQLTLNYSLNADYTDYRVYPLTGYSLTANIRQRGLGLFANQDNRVFSIDLSFNWHTNIYKRLYFATGAKFRTSLPIKQSYYMLDGLGFSTNHLRGYEYYAFDTQSFVLLKNNFKFELLPRKVLTIKLIPFSQFNKVHFAIYINAFFDVGIGYDDTMEYKTNSNYMTNKLLYSGGVGIDLITYYDKVFRVDYSINQLGERGVFLHFDAPIR